MCARCSPASGSPLRRTGGSAEPGARWEEQEPFAGTQDEAATQLGARLRAIVEARLGSARDVGVFLSGGLDSSLIAALLTAAGARVHLFTLDFGLPSNADVACAKRVARHLQRPLHVVHVGPREIARALEPTAAALQQPFGDGVTVPLYLLGKAAAQEVDTIFSGEGGDQLFGGWANKPMIAAELHGGEGYDRLS